MQTMNQSLASNLKRRLISLDDAMTRTPDADELRNLIGNAGGAPPAARRVAS
jgi:twitching motility protein PilT